MSENCICDKIKDDVVEIKVDLKEVRVDLNAHMSRSAASEARLDIMEDFVKQANEQSQKNFDAMLLSNRDNQEALNKQIKLLLGVFTGMAALVGAFVTLFQYLN